MRICFQESSLYCVLPLCSFKRLQNKRLSGFCLSKTHSTPSSSLSQVIQCMYTYAYIKIHTLREIHDTCTCTYTYVYTLISYRVSRGTTPSFMLVSCQAPGEKRVSASNPALAVSFWRHLYSLSPAYSSLSKPDIWHTCPT